MNTIPVTVLDNFFENPDAIRDWALKLDYKKSPDNIWPGKKSEDLRNLHLPFYDLVNQKVLKLFFSNPINSFNCELNFQIFGEYEDTGWIHQDTSLFTIIIYLFEENNINCGTSLYKLRPTKMHPYNHPDDLKIQDQRKNFHQNLKYPPSILEKKKKYESSTFEKVLDIKDRYNRLICFPSEHFHAANYFSNKSPQPRLTLIGFMDSVSLNNESYPVIRSKQTPMM